MAGYNNKVVYFGQTLMDLTGDTATAADVAQGKTFHLASGAPATGTASGGTDTSDATATAANIFAGKTAYVADGKVTGTAAVTVVGTNIILPEGLVTVNA